MTAAVFSPPRWTGRFALAPSGVVQPQRPVSSGVGRSAVLTFRRATIADDAGARHASSTDEPSRTFFGVDSDRASFRPDAANLREWPRSAREAGHRKDPFAAAKSTVAVKGSAGSSKTR